jgi:hypothetical protein
MTVVPMHCDPRYCRGLAFLRVFADALRSRARLRLRIAAC